VPRHGQLALAHHGDEHIERLLGDAVDLLDVEQAARPERLDERAVDEDVRVVALGQHLRGVEVADEPGGGQLGVALDEEERGVPAARHGPEKRGLPRAGRAFEHHMRPGVERGDEQFCLAFAPEHRGQVERRSPSGHRHPTEPWRKVMRRARG
jgi:hypothetical protein